MNTPPALPTLSEADREQFWPPLPFAEWQTTAETLHMWTQIVGKIRLALTPWINHSWHVTLYLTSRGLTTSPIPHGFTYVRDPVRLHQSRIAHSEKRRRACASSRSSPQSVAAFYREVMHALDELQLPVQDRSHCLTRSPIRSRSTATRRIAPTIPAQANRFWRVLLQSDRVLKKFRSRFCGKCSPVHFFWGSFDLAVTRFSGRSGAAASGRHSAPARRRHARSLRAGSEQRRLLAGQCGQPHPALLFLRLSRAARICRGKGATGRGFVLCAVARIRSCPTTRSAPRASPDDDAARLRAERLRCGLTPRQMGSRRARRSEAQAAGRAALSGRSLGVSPASQRLARARTPCSSGHDRRRTIAPSLRRPPRSAARPVARSRPAE